jgi:hypothetical protein
MQVLRTEKEKISEELKTMTAEKKQQLGQELLGS